MRNAMLILQNYWRLLVAKRILIMANLPYRAIFGTPIQILHFAG